MSRQDRLKQRMKKLIIMVPTHNPVVHRRKCPNIQTYTQKVWAVKGWKSLPVQVKLVERKDFHLHLFYGLNWFLTHANVKFEE